MRSNERAVVLHTGTTGIPYRTVHWEWCTCTPTSRHGRIVATARYRRAVAGTRLRLSLMHLAVYAASRHE